MNNLSSPTLCCEGVALVAIPTTDACATIPRLSQITGFIMLPYGAKGPDNWTDYDSFSAIIDNTDLTGTKGKIVFCRGELLAPTDITAQLGKNAKQFVRKRWELKAEVPIIADSIYTFLQTIGGCKIGFRLWFTTLGGRLIGGPTGINLSYVKSDPVFRGGDSDVEIGEVVFTWYGGLLGAAAEWSDSGGVSPVQPSLMIFQDVFANSSDGILSWTKNSGVLPSPNEDAQILVFMQGQKLWPSQYQVQHLTGPAESQIIVNANTHWAGASYEVIAII